MNPFDLNMGQQDGDGTFPYGARLSQLHSLFELETPSTTIVVNGGDIATSFEDAGGQAQELLEAIATLREECKQIQALNEELDASLAENIIINTKLRDKLNKKVREAEKELKEATRNCVEQQEQAENNAKREKRRAKKEKEKRIEAETAMSVAQEQAAKESARTQASIDELKRMAYRSVSVKAEHSKLKKKYEVLERLLVFMNGSLTELLETEGVGETFLYFLLLIAKNIAVNVPVSTVLQFSQQELQAKSLRQIYEEVEKIGVLKKLQTHFPLPSRIDTTKLSDKVRILLHLQVMLNCHVDELQCKPSSHQGTPGNGHRSVHNEELLMTKESWSARLQEQITIGNQKNKHRS